MILFLLISLANASQMVTWTHPEGMDKDYKIQGYYLEYQIFNTKEECDPKAETPYFVDMKFKTEHDLMEDPNFQAGKFYLFAMSSYNETGLSHPTNSLPDCVEIKGKPKVEDFEVQDENISKEENKTDEKTVVATFDSIPDPINSPRSGGNSKPKVGSRGAAVNGSVPPVLLGKRSISKPGSYRGWKTSSKTNDVPKLHASGIKRHVAKRDRILLPVNSVQERKRNDVRVDKVERVVQEDAGSASERANGVPNGVKILAGILLTSIIGLIGLKA